MAYYIWDALVANKPKYDRFDSADYFKEYGIFVTAKQNKAWDECWISGTYFSSIGSRDDGSITRFSSSKNAYIEFDWNLADYKKCNFIYRSDTLAAKKIIVSISKGPNYVQLESGEDAHNYEFSMHEPNSSQFGWGNSIYQKRLKLQSLASTGTITVRISKGNNNNRILYWGTEKYNGFTTFVINVARGSHNFYRPPNNLSRFIENDVYERAPALIILEQCINNSYLSSWNFAYDFVWGDRPGYENPNSLKSRSNDWTDYEVISFIPHMPYSFVEDGYIAERYKHGWDKTKALFIEKDDIFLIDMTEAFISEANSQGWDYGEATIGSGVKGETFTTDNTHPNDQGTLIYRKHFIPIFEY